MNLSPHDAKATAAWYERMMARRDGVSALLDEPTVRAWRLDRAGSSGNFLNHGVHVYRLCEATAVGTSPPTALRKAQGVARRMSPIQRTCRSGERRA